MCQARRTSRTLFSVPLHLLKFTALLASSYYTNHPSFHSFSLFLYLFFLSLNLSICLPAYLPFRLLLNSLASSRLRRALASSVCLRRRVSRVRHPLSSLQRAARLANFRLRDGAAASSAPHVTTSLPFVQLSFWLLQSRNGERESPRREKSDSILAVTQYRLLSDVRLSGR